MTKPLLPILMSLALLAVLTPALAQDGAAPVVTAPAAPLKASPALILACHRLRPALRRREQPSTWRGRGAWCGL